MTDDNASTTPTPDPRVGLLDRFRTPPITEGVPEEQHAEFLQPSVGFVVHELVRQTEQARKVWAWCRVEVDRPGYAELYFTKPDGSTPTDPGKDEIQLGKVLFQVWC